MSDQQQKNSIGDIADTAASWLFRHGAGLTETERSEFEEWRAADPRHTSAFAELEKDWSILGRPLASGRSETILRELGARSRRRRFRRVAWASAACLALLVGSLWRHQTPSPASPSSQVAIVAPDKRTLSDGSVAELKPGAEIAIHFTGSTRGVTLVRGQAHFQVAHDPTKPFIVTARGVEFRAVGTAFSVELADESVELLVTQGRVAVEKSLSAPSPTTSPGVVESPQALATVGAGNRVVVSSDNKTVAAAPSVTPIASEEMADQLAWRIPRIDFTRTPLSEAVALMNRHNQTRMQMTIDEVALGKLPVSGLFRADRVDAFVRLLEANFGIETETAGQTIHLRKRH